VSILHAKIATLCVDLFVHCRSYIQLSLQPRAAVSDQRQLLLVAETASFGRSWQVLAGLGSSVSDLDPGGSGFKSPVWIQIRNLDPDPAIEIELFYSYIEAS